MKAGEHHSDPELVALLVEGDAAAFELIYRRYAGELYAYARRSIPVREDCEELVQEVFGELWENHAKLGFVTLLKGYLYRLIRFRIVKYFRREKVRHRYEEHYAIFEVLYDNIADDSSDSGGIRAVIEAGLSELPVRCQEAVRLRLDENLTNDAIAHRMNIKKSTVENYMVTAVSHLRATFHRLKTN